MRPKLLMAITVLLMLCALLAGICYRDYDRHQKTVVASKHASQQVNAELATLRKANDEWVTRYNALWEQCQKGVSAYNLLSTVNKVPTNMPNCGLSVLQ